MSGSGGTGVAADGDGGRTRVAVVTGASSGIGAATARLLGAGGWSVVLVARRADRLADVARDVEASGGRALVAAIDAADGAAVEAMAMSVVTGLGLPDAVVNSAGAGVWRWMEDTSHEELGRLLGAPFLAAWNTTRAFLPGMLARGSGVIVHVGSPASVAPWPGATGYTTSRWALRGMHEALRQDLAGSGVASCHVLFGEVDSEYFDANPNTREHIPRVGRLIGVISPERAARTVVRVIERPRAQVFDPPMLAAMQVANRISPSLVALLARRTGRQRG
jgi:NADP-dependent 3-hydroxy acid dehydrogenase YdfG